MDVDYADLVPHPKSRYVCTQANDHLVIPLTGPPAFHLAQ